MKQDDGSVKRNPLKNSQKFGTNKLDSSGTGLATAVLMKKRGEEFLPGDLVFAQFTGYSWPALVTQVGAKNLEVVTLVLEQDEMINKDSAVIFHGMDQLKQIMSVLTPGEQQDFSEASNSLLLLSLKTRQERLDIIKMGRSDFDEGESSKENKIFMSENESPVSECTKSPPKLQMSPKMESSMDSNGVKEIKKLSCDVDDISLPIVGSRLEKIIDQPRPRLTLEVGVPNFGPLDPLPVNSEGESEIEVKLNKSSESLLTPEKEASLSKRKKLQVKQQRDEDFIANAVKLTNKLLQTGGPSVELVPGHHLSYDSLKIARERAMAIAGCASPIISRTRRQSANKSTEASLTSPEDRAAKAHAEHLKATRAAQKKALKAIGKPLEIVQTTVKNPSKKPGRKSSSNVNSSTTKVAAEIAFIEAAEKLVANADIITSNATEPERALAAAAKESAQELVSINQQVNVSPLKSPARKRRLSKRQGSTENKVCEIIVNSKSVEEIQKTLSPQKIVSPSALQLSELQRSEKIKAVRCESLKRAREIKMQMIAEKKLAEQASPKAKSNRKSSKSLSVTSPISPKLIDEPKKHEKARIGGSTRRSRRCKSDIVEKSLTSAPEKEQIKSPSKNSVQTPSELTSEMGAVMEQEKVDDEFLSKPITRRKSRRAEASEQELTHAKNEKPSRSKCCRTPSENIAKTEELHSVNDEIPASTDKEKHSNSMEDSDKPTAIKSNPVDKPSSSKSEIINFLCPYYLNLFTNVIKEKIESQIKLDLEKLPQEERTLISNLVEGTNRSTRKQAYEIISKLVKNSPCQNLLTSNLPEVGPGTPPASPKTEVQRISNKVIPQTRKRNSNSNCHEVVHNPFPVETMELTEKARKKYVESGDLPKKHSVIPRTWSQYLKNNGRFATEQSKPVSVADKLKSPPSKSPSSALKPQNKRKKTDSPQSIKKEKNIELPTDFKMMALLFYVKDIQINLPEPFKLKQSEVKWTDLSSESQNKYIELCERLNVLSTDEKNLECTALDLFVRSASNISRLDWLSLSPTKHKKFLREAKKMTKKTAASLAETNEFSEKLVNKLINSESRKRKRESQPVDTDSEPSSKKEKSDDTLLDFFCMDCFTLDYNPKQYATCHGCHASFHRTCLESQHNSTKDKQDNKQRFYCRECQEGPVCLLCRKGNNLKSCSQCPYKYHESCVTPHMSTQVVSTTSFICPYHVCGSCEARPELNIKNFVRCVRCPQSFHHNHIPAGCMRISRSHILCFRHYQGFGKKLNPTVDAEQKLKRKRKSGSSLAQKKGKQNRKLAHLNVPFCFQCTFGGELICCEGCPASFHNECVPEENQIKEGEMSWLCPDCIVGKKPFIGDIVWVKFGAYRWWPCQVLDELDLPDNIFSRPHKPCQFPAICLGTKEFAWLDMSRVYSYEDGDKGSSSSNGMSASFKLAIIEAKDLHAAVKPMKEALLQETESLDRPSTKKPAPFKFIRMNTPYNSAMKEYEKQLKLERMPFPCDCTMADKCSAESSCINRVLLTECPTGCRWGDECENQRFQRRQYPSTKLVKTEGRGWGLVVNEDVTQGTLVHEYVGEIIDEQEVQNRLQNYQASGITDYYMLTVENSRIIDAKPKANNARFMNHSCDPNCETQKWNVLGLTCIGLFAKCDIKAGEELTFDYQFDTRGQEKKACLCGSANCSGFLGVPAKKIIEPTNKETKKKPKKKRRKKPAVAAKSSSSLHSEKSSTEDKSGETIAEPEHSTVKSKAPMKGGKSAKKTVGLPVRSNRKVPVKGVKSSTKSVLKNTILSKRRTKAEENDIEDDLQKINAIVRDVNDGESGSSQPEK